ncbi:Aste57867_80 [Aphanomyces stellatus]|uniref:Aste57867_80 protein n=1 Tax=Aphanomyces stellatus TaxID=120398 RepID=A0A485K258_9STRA|nr:hypothetical protein As57867_000080 [Aphanomyces stellatus]VFT77306.1 Aste57867_80 [Aphanomyces stellatus]
MQTPSEGPSHPRFVTLEEATEYIQSHPAETLWHVYGNYYMFSKAVASSNHTVFNATHKRQTNKPFVVKLTHQQQELDFVECMFSNDIRGASDHLVECLEWCPVKIAGYDCLALVMECGRDNCNDLLPQLQAEPYSRLRCIDHVAKAVAFLHANGYIHGDIKLENVVDFGRFKLIDFDNGMKMDGRVLMPKQCTKPYCPPELARHMRRGGPAVVASVKFDMWCLGVLVLKLFLKDGELVEFAKLRDDQDILDVIAADHFSFQASLDAAKLDPRQRHYLSMCLHPDPTERAGSVDVSVLKLVKVKTHVTDREREDAAAAFRSSSLGSHASATSRSRARRWVKEDPFFTAMLASLARESPGSSHRLWEGYAIHSTALGRTVFEAMTTSTSASSLVVKLSKTQDTAFLEAMRAAGADAATHLVGLVKWGRVNLHDMDCYALAMERGDVTADTVAFHHDVPLRLQCIEAVAHALAFLHTHKYIHGDVHLRNVMRFDDGRFKLIDVGHVVKWGDEMPPYATAPYVPPEMARYLLRLSSFVEAAPTFDVYCLGVVVLRLFVANGVLVEFQGLDDMAILAVVAAAGFSFQASVEASQLSADQRKLLLTCLEPDRTKRASTVAPILQLLASDLPTSTHASVLHLPALWTLTVEHNRKTLPEGNRLRALPCRLHFVPLGTTSPPIVGDSHVMVQADSSIVAMALPFMAALHRYLEACHILSEEYDVVAPTTTWATDIHVDALGKTIAALGTIHHRHDTALAAVDAALGPLVERLRCEELDEAQVAQVAVDVDHAFRIFCTDREVCNVAADFLDAVQPLHESLWGLHEWRHHVRLAAVENNQRNFEILTIWEQAKNILDLSDETSIVMAAENGNVHTVKALLAHELPSDNDMTNALVQAARHGHDVVVDHLLKFNANINHRNDDGETALIVAVKQGHVHVVRQLLDAGADMSLEYMVSDNSSDDDGYIVPQTVLGVAQAGGHTEIAALLQARATPIGSLEALTTYIQSFSSSEIGWPLMGDYALVPTALSFSNSLTLFHAVHKTDPTLVSVVKLTDVAPPSTDTCAFLQTVETIAELGQRIFKYAKWGPVTIQGYECFAVIMERSDGGAADLTSVETAIAAVATMAIQPFTLERAVRALVDRWTSDQASDASQIQLPRLFDAFCLDGRLAVRVQAIVDAIQTETPSGVVLPGVFMVEASSPQTSGVFDVAKLRDVTLRLSFRCERYSGRSCPCTATTTTTTTTGDPTATIEVLGASDTIRRALPALKATSVLLQCLSITELFDLRLASHDEDDGIQFDMTKMHTDMRLVQALETIHGPTPSLPLQVAAQPLLDQLNDERLSDEDAITVFHALREAFYNHRTSASLASLVESLGVDVQSDHVGGLTKTMLPSGDVRWVCLRHSPTISTAPPATAVLASVPIAVDEPTMVPLTTREAAIDARLEYLRSGDTTVYDMLDGYELLTGDPLAASVFHCTHRHRRMDAVVVKLSTSQREMELFEYLNTHGGPGKHVVEWRTFGRIDFGLGEFDAIVMERGKDLRAVFATTSGDAMKLAKYLNVDQLAQALRTLHGHSFVHGNLCLENVVRCGDLGLAKLIDFAHATRYGDPLLPHARAAVEYCPPEMALYLLGRGPKPVAAASYDLWCLAVLILKLFSPDLALVEFATDDADAIVRKLADDAFSFDRSIRLSSLRSAHKVLLKKCLARDVGARGTLKDIENLLPKNSTDLTTVEKD